MSDASFCWHCSCAFRSAVNSRQNLKKYYIKTQDGIMVRVHQMCVSAAEASVRRLTAAPPDHVEVPPPEPQEKELFASRKGLHPWMRNRGRKS